MKRKIITKYKLFEYLWKSWNNDELKLLVHREQDPWPQYHEAGLPCRGARERGTLDKKNAKDNKLYYFLGEFRHIGILFSDRIAK